MWRVENPADLLSADQFLRPQLAAVIPVSSAPPGPSVVKSIA